MRIGSAGTDPRPQEQRPRGRTAPARGRRSGRRDHPRARAVRLRDDRLDVRHHAQPLGPRPFAGRLVGRLGGSRGLGHRAGGARERRHGVDPDPVGLLRAGRDQAGTGRGARRPGRRLLVRDGRERPAGDHRRRRRADAVRAGGPPGARRPRPTSAPCALPSPPGCPARPRSAGRGGPRPPRAQTCSARRGTGWSRRTRPTARCWPSPRLVRWTAGAELDAREPRRPVQAPAARTPARGAGPCRAGRRVPPREGTRQVAREGRALLRRPRRPADPDARPASHAEPGSGAPGGGGRTSGRTRSTRPSPPRGTWPAGRRCRCPPAPSPSGTPLAVQLVGPPGSEATLLAVARQLETAQPWRRVAPGFAND